MADDDTRTRILKTAGEIFADKGYAAATIREICDAAHVNLAAVNYYFGCKESLYSEVLQHARLRNDRDDALPVWPPATPPAVKLKFVIHQLVSQLLSLNEDDPWEARLMVREIINPTAAGKRMLRDRFRQGFGQMLAILDEIVPPEMPRHQRHQIGFSILGQCSLYRALGKVIPLLVDEEEQKQHYGSEELAEHICQVSLAALGLAPPLVAPPAKARSGKRAAPLVEPIKKMS